MSIANLQYGFRLLMISSNIISKLQLKLKEEYKNGEHKCIGNDRN